MTRTFALAGALLAISIPTLALAQSPSPGVSPPDPFTLVATLDQAATGLVRPTDLAVGPDGNLYIADLEPSIRVITPTGEPVRTWGTPGSEPGQLNFGPSLPDIAVDADGLVYVLEGGNRRVEVFQPDGTLVRGFGSFGTGPGQFVAPINMTLDSAGNVYVIDDQAQTINKFDPDGGLLWTIGGSGRDRPGPRRLPPSGILRQRGPVLGHERRQRPRGGHRRRRPQGGRLRWARVRTRAVRGDGLGRLRRVR